MLGVVTRNEVCWKGDCRNDSCQNDDLSTRMRFQ